MANEKYEYAELLEDAPDEVREVVREQACGRLDSITRMLSDRMLAENANAYLSPLETGPHNAQIKAAIGEVEELVTCITDAYHALDGYDSEGSDDTAILKKVAGVLCDFIQDIWPDDCGNPMFDSSVPGDR